MPPIKRVILIVAVVEELTSVVPNDEETAERVTKQNVTIFQFQTRFGVRKIRATAIVKTKKLKANKFTKRQQ